MLDLIELFFKRFFGGSEISSVDIWNYCIIEDNRTMLVGVGDTKEESESSMLIKSSERDVLIDLSGLLKIIMPYGIRYEDEIPQEIIQAMSEHFGVENIFAKNENT